jgi:hypothetical protein
VNLFSGDKAKICSLYLCKSVSDSTGQKSLIAK